MKVLLFLIAAAAGAWAIALAIVWGVSQYLF